MRRPRGLRLAVAAAVVAVLAGGVYLLRADRHRLYTSDHAARCWEAVKALASPTSSLRLARVEVLDREDGGVDVVVGYRMDRVLGGLELEARCRYPAGSTRASTILVNGQPVEDPLSDEGGPSPP